jgi:hypothetical protein
MDLAETIETTIVAEHLRPLLDHTSDSLRTSLEQARGAIADRAPGALPSSLLESPALLAITSHLLPQKPPPAPARWSLPSWGASRWLLLSLVVAVTATLAAFAIAAVVRELRRESTSGTSGLPAGPRDRIAIPVTESQAGGTSAPSELPAAEAMETLAGAAMDASTD